MLGDAQTLRSRRPAQRRRAIDALGSFAEKPVTLHLTKELPLGAHLQALQDAAPFLTVFVRDYGLFFTVDNAPPDGVSYLDFWHGKSKSDGKKP